MPRWQPDPRSRIEEAALELFVERGFDGTTIEDIAARAGLQKRSFFRLFRDKREVLFGGTDDYAHSVGDSVRDAPVGAAPWPVLMGALAESAGHFRRGRAQVRTRRDVIEANTELLERQVLKIAQLREVLLSSLTTRGVEAHRAHHLVGVALVAYGRAYERWLEPDNDEMFTACMAAASDELMHVLQSDVADPVRTIGRIE